MRVSVVLPVFNGAASLGGAIGSILAQTLLDFELLVINDGSKDESANVARSFNDPRIRVIDLEANLGLIAALNIGLAEARGEFLARMDHDDIAHPERLQRQVDAMMAHDVVICGSAIQPFGTISGRPISYPLTDIEIRAVLPVVSPFAHPTVTMRTDICRTLGYVPSAKHCEDYDLWWRLSQHGKMMNLPEALLNYRFHEAQISANHGKEQFSGMAAVATKNLRNEGRFREENDLRLHLFALTYERLTSVDELVAVGEWLRWLRMSFDIEGGGVASHYLRVWRGVCSRQPHLGAKLWSVYKKFLPCEAGLGSDMLVMLAAFGGVGADDSMTRKLRRIVRR